MIRKSENVLIGTDGCLVRVDSPLIAGWEPCNDMALAKASAGHKLSTEVQEGLKFCGPKIPASELKKVLGTITSFKHTETGYLLKYNVRTSSWKITCPEQRGSGGGVTFYDNDASEGGFLEVGTIHTHPEMGAFWSGTDMNDQRGKHGIHVVFGTRGGKVAESKTSIFSLGKSYDIDMFDLFEEVDLAADYEPVKDWEDTIKKQYDKKDTPMHLTVAARQDSKATLRTTPGIGRAKYCGTYSWRSDDLYGVYDKTPTDFDVMTASLTTTEEADTLVDVMRYMNVAPKDLLAALMAKGELDVGTMVEAAIDSVGANEELVAGAMAKDIVDALDCVALDPEKCLEAMRKEFDAAADGDAQCLSFM